MCVYLFMFVVSRLFASVAMFVSRLFASGVRCCRESVCEHVLSVLVSEV